MNKVIISENDLQKETSFSALRRINILAEKMSEEELAHFGVMGMKWGVRKARETAPVSSQKSNKFVDNMKGDFANKSAIGRYLTVAKYREAATRAGATKKQYILVSALLGTFWGTRYFNRMAKNNANPRKQKQALAKEIKTMRKAILNKFSDKQDDIYHNAFKQFEAKYGKQRLFEGGIFDKTLSKSEKKARNDDFDQMIAKSAQNIFNQAANSVLAGSNYVINVTNSDNSYNPQFELSIKDNG